MKADALVIGAGIAGLVAGLRLAKSGRSVIIIERSDRAGGQCGTFEHEGFEVVFGCNDFGTGFERCLASLGVDVRFHHPRARFHFGARTIELPPNARTLAQLALRTPAIVKLVRAAKTIDTLGPLVDRIGDPLLADLACLPAFAMVRSPDDVPLAALKADFSKELGYGYDKSCAPIGGPGARVDAMVARFRALGGTLLLDQRAERSERCPDGRHIVHTSNGVLRARALLSSEGRWSEYPAEAKRGLDVGLVMLVTDAGSKSRFPAGFHTVDWFAPGVASQLRKLDAGEPVAEPSFHAFRSDLRPRDGRSTVSAFVPLARGEGAPSPARRDALTQHVKRTLGRLVPGFEDTVHATFFVSPDEYEARLGFRPRPSARVLPAGIEKPRSYDAVRDVHFLGTSVDPPGEHAGAAALSGLRAAERIIEAHERTTAA